MTTVLTPEQEQECRKLKALFDERAGMSQRAFVKKYNLGTPANLGQYLLGRRPLTLGTALRIAKPLGIQIAEFSTRLAAELDNLHIDDNVTPAKDTRMKKIPVISEIQAGLFTEAGQLTGASTCIENGDYIYVDAEMPDGVFAMKVRGDSMQPVFQEGDTIVIDPSIRPRPGDYVVAERTIDGETSGTFKKYRERGYDDFGNTIYELVPLNDNYPTLSSNQAQCRIIGVMVEHRRTYRRR